VGRLAPEKNVRFLAQVEQALLAADAPPFRFLVIGAGSERRWLMDHLRNAVFPGVLAGEELARNYANMDLFLFPSHTDTFGNVALEAMASGVPVVGTADGWPKYLVRKGVTGFIAGTAVAFVESVLRIMRDPARHSHERQAAREHVRQYSWNKVFEEEVYEAYRICLGNCLAAPAPSPAHADA